MDTVLTVVLVTAIIGLLVGAAFLPGWVRRSSTAAGARAGARFTAERMARDYIDIYRRLARPGLHPHLGTRRPGEDVRRPDEDMTAMA